MAQVYSTVLEGEPLGPRVKLRSEEWLETGGKKTGNATSTWGERAILGIDRVILGLLVLAAGPVFITHIVPGMVSRQTVPLV